MTRPVAPGHRVGWGIDAHPFNDEPPLLLAGVGVSDEVGAEATSDGDVLAHAVIDAVLGACVLGDIGDHFPSSDPEMAGADSMEMLRRAVRLAGAAGWRVVHLDATVVGERIRVAPHREAIRQSLAGGLGIEVAAVSVKATGTDGLGFVGSGEGIMATAVATVEPTP
jgi:2-C-methyl-D-erythritol 2,4-cyclodiphosphate synthase